MASRDEILRFIVETSGDENVIKLAKAIAEVGKASGDAAPEADALLTELERITRLGSNIQQFIKLKAELADTEAKFNAAQKSAKELADELSRTAATSKEVNSAYAKSDKEVAALTDKFAAQSLELKKLEGSLAKAGIDTANLAAASQKLKDQEAGVTAKISEFAAAAEKAGTATKDAAAGTKSLGDESSKASGLFAAVSDNLGKIALAAGAAAIAMKGVKFGADSVAKAAAVEESLSRVKALAEGTQAQFTALGRAVNEASRELNIAPEAAAAGLVALAEQGRNAGDAMKQLVPTLQLAKVANIEVGDAAGIVAGIMDTFGKSAGDAAHVVDLLVAASKGGKGTVADLGAELGKLAPLARDLGLSLDQTVAILGTLVTNGVNAGTASKGLAAIFTDLKNPASQLRQELFALGDRTDNFAKAVATLTGSGQQGRDALDKLDESSRKVILALGQLGPDALAKFAAGLKDVEGTASRTAKAIDDNLSGSITHFKNALDRIGEGLADPVLEPLKKEIESLAKALDEFAASPAFEDLKRSIGDLATQGAKAFDDFIRGIDWKSLIDSAQATLRGAADSFREFGGSISTISTGVNEAIQAIGATFNSVSAIIHLFASVGAQAIGVVLDGLAKLEEAHAFVSFGQEAQEAANRAKELKSAAEAFYASANKNIQQADASAEAAGKNFDKLGQALDEIPPKGQAAGDALKQTGDAAQQAATSTDALAQGAQQAAVATGELADKTVKVAEGLDAAKERFAAATVALSELYAAGVSAGDALDKAKAEFFAARTAIQDLEKASKGAASAQKDLATAFATLRISSQADLEKTARTYESAMDVIVAAAGRGEASQEDVKRAFIAMAQAQLDAARDSDAATRAQVESQLKVQASVLGVTAALKDLGLVGAEAGNKVATSADNAAQSLDKLAQNADAAAESAGTLASEGEHAADNLDRVGQAASDTAIGLGDVSKAFLDAAASGGQLDRIEFGKLKAQQQAAADYLQQLEQQIAGTDELAQRIEALRAQYNFLGEDQLRALAEKEKQLADLQRRKEEQSARDRGSQRDSGGGSGGGNDSPPTGGGGGGGGGGRPSGGGSSGSSGGISVNVSGSLLGSNPQELAEALARIIKPQLDAINRRSL